jgi:hypothetical protein
MGAFRLGGEPLERTGVDKKNREFEAKVLNPGNIL